jgi:hypothetical protein
MFFGEPFLISSFNVPAARVFTSETFGLRRSHVSRDFRGHGWPPERTEKLILPDGMELPQEISAKESAANPVAPSGRDSS